MKNGKPRRTYDEARPIAVNPRILRANCCRWRTVSATMSNRPARLPPTWRWIGTAVITKEKFSEPARLEGVPALRGGGGGDGEGGKLVADGEHPPLGLERDPDVGDSGADAERD